jgi:putative endonuclease
LTFTGPGVLPKESPWENPSLSAEAGCRKLTAFFVSYQVIAFSAVQSDLPFFMPYFAYILKSLSHGTYYYGSTADVEERLKIHNKGKVRYTKGRRPWILHYKESFTSRSEAFKREQFFKSVEGNLYLKAQRLI